MSRDQGSGDDQESITQSGRRRRRLGFVLAAVLTASMLGWQSIHLYGAFQHAARQESGSCATKLTEAVYIGGQRQMDLLRDLEHELIVFGVLFDASAQAVWRDEYQRADDQLTSGLEAAGSATSGDLHQSIDDVWDSYRVVSGHVASAFSELERGSLDGAVGVVTSSAYQAAREELRSTLGEVVIALDSFITARVEQERRDELVSVTGAILLFIAAVGAWAFFLRRLRQSDIRLAREAAHRRQTERELQQAQKMEALGVMAGGIAHDVGNLNSVIAGSVASARAHPGDGANLDRALSRIELAARDTGTLVEGLLTFAKRTPSDRHALDLGALAVAAEPLMRSAVPPRVSVTVTTSDDTWIEGDPSQLRQALLNLVVNAGEAMPEGGDLGVSVSAVDAGTVELTVSDTGRGIASDVLSHVFEPFFTTRGSGAGGTGLGLAIVHGIVTEHGGTIAIESAEGAGTTIRLTFPRVDPASPVLPMPGGDPLNGTVLVVALAGYAADLVSEALVHDGNTVVRAGTAEEAARSLSEVSVDVMVVTEEMRDVLDEPGHPSVPTILLTGPDGPEPPGVTVLHHPYSLTDLSRLVSALLAGAQIGER